MGSQAGRYRRLHALFAGLRSRVDYRPETLAWAAHEGVLYVACGGRAASVPYDALLLATGARDRVMPLPGWTLPGVFTLGGAQAILKDQGCFIGRRTAFVGSSPLLGLAALQYRKLGADIAVVADTTAVAAKLAAWRDLFACPLTLGRGLAYRARLEAAGLLVLDGVDPLAIEGEDHVRAVRLRDSAGVERTIACDAVALGYGLEPEAQLAELAGASFTFDPDLRQWFPQIDADGRAGLGLYLAGDGAATGGADAAEASGTLAALAILSDLGGGARNGTATDPAAARCAAPAPLPAGARVRLRLAGRASRAPSRRHRAVPLRGRYGRGGAADGGRSPSGRKTSTA